MRRPNWLPVVGQWPMSLQDAAKAGTEYIEWTDSMARESDIPLVAWIVRVQDAVFGYADQLGVGQEVRAMVYAIRGAGYVGVAAANLGFGVSGTVGTAALGAGLVSSLGAFGAVAAGGVVALAVSLLWSDDDSEAAKKKRKKRREKLERDLRAMLKPVTLGQLADEQEESANAWTMPSIAPSFGFAGSGSANAQEQLARKATAAKLATFFRAAKSNLSTKDRGLFESMINIGRWGHAIALYEALSPNMRAKLSEMAYEGAWKMQPKPGPGYQPQESVPVTPIVDYGVRIKAKLDGALSALQQTRWQGSVESGGGTSKAALLFGAGALVAWAALSPATALATWRAASGIGSRLWTGARRLIP